jgi:transposase
MSKMMVEQQRAESLFYYFRLEDQIPNEHLLRLIDQHIDFSFVRERLRNFYSSTGRPSIDPEVLLRLLLVGYLYGITSERRLLEEGRMHRRIAGSLDSVLNGRFPTIRRSLRTVMGVSGSPVCFAKFLRRLCVVVWRPAWWRDGASP